MVEGGTMIRKDFTRSDLRTLGLRIADALADFLIVERKKIVPIDVEDAEPLDEVAQKRATHALKQRGIL